MTSAERAIIDLEQKLEATLDTAERDKLLRLLIKVVDDLADEGEIRGIIERRLAEGAERVSKQRELVALLKKHGYDRSDAYFTLVTLNTILALFVHRLALIRREAQHGGSWAGVTVPTENLKPLGAMRVNNERIRADPSPRPLAFGSGAIIGTLGGLLGLGGAEFRLPLLIKTFRFRGLEAVILNKAVSLVVVATALPFRASAVPLMDVADMWTVIVNILAGSLLGAWVGAEWATRLKSATLYRVIAVLLVVTAGVLFSTHDAVAGAPAFDGPVFVMACFVVGFVIGVIASLLGVAGGEFLIPALVLICGIDIKMAGSLSLALSLPTMLVGFARYSRDQSFSVLSQNRAFFLVMAAGSILGTFIGGLLLGVVPNAVLLPLLVALLLLSAIKVWRHE